MDFDKVDENWQSTVFVTVVDKDGNPVAGATVEAGWLGVITGAQDSAETDENGIAGPFHANKNPATKEVTFCISNLIRSRYTYNKSANELTCLFINPDAK
jgi:hypothetical protein